MFEARAKLGSALVGMCLILAAGAASRGAISDPLISPADDFYGYANAGWLGASRLPEGMARIDTTSALRTQNAQRVRNLVEEAVEASDGGRHVRAEVRKMADFYATRLHIAGIEAKGLAPLADDLAAIAAITDRHSLAAWLGRITRLDDGGNQQTESLWGVWVHQGFHDPYRYAAHMVQGGLGLSGREDYIDPGADAALRRNDYRARIAHILALAGSDRAEARAAGILDLEIAIAGTHASRADTENVFKTDNEWRASDFPGKAPGIDWPAYFSAAGLDAAPSFVVWQPQAVTGGARLVANWPLAVWKDYLTFHLIEHYAPVLPHAFGGGGPGRAMAATEAVFGDAIGRLYVERYFPWRAKAAATVMVEHIRTAFRTRLAKTRWMSPETKAKALAKLAALGIGLGHPDAWTNYTQLEIVRGDALGNTRRAEAFAYANEAAKLRRRVDADEWPAQLHPQMVGAILGISPNSMHFAAGLLQPPYFDPEGDAAANYGSAGAGLAHEISHSFDEIGNLYDAQGRLGLWWSPDDLSRYRAATEPLAAQLGSCSALPGQPTHGKQVLAESASDLGGLAVAYDAYRLSLHGRLDAIKNGLTGDQRFFIAFAQRWRRLETGAALGQQIATDNHAPPVCRSNLVRNNEAWARAFGVKPGDGLYLAPETRIQIW